MGYSLNAVQAEAVLQALKQNYSVYAPKRFPKQGRYSDTDVIKYAEVEHYEDIVWQVKSDYPAKEVLTPIQQAIFYFTEDEYRASKGPKKPILILARPCDINAQHVQAKIYAGNGGYTDLYYERMREKVKFALMECNGGDAPGRLHPRLCGGERAEGHRPRAGRQGGAPGPQEPSHVEGV